jgi:N4-gp56 family major capsid protein
VADQPTTFAQLAQDAPNVWIAERQYQLAERNLILGRYAEQYTLPQRMGKTLRVTRHDRLQLPSTPLTEGVPPDAVPLTIKFVDVAVEQWGIVCLLTDVVMLTTKHPALNKAVDLTGLAMAELLEREIATVLMGGTSVVFGGAATSRAALTAGDKLTTTVILKTLAALRARGAPPWEGQLYAGVISPQQEADVLATDATFQAASNFANVRALQYGEIGIWQGVRWGRGNFMPYFKGVPAPDAAAATAEKAQVSVLTGGGTLAAGNYKIKVVAADPNSGYERKISLDSANLTAAANDRLQVVFPSSTAYVYNVYMTQVGGTTFFLRSSRNAAGSTLVISSQPAGTEATVTQAPANGVEVFIGWVFGRDAFGRVELNGMSLQSYVTPPGASWSNPLAQGRKVGSKIAWKCFLQEPLFFTRLETGSAFPADLAA